MKQITLNITFVILVSLVVTTLLAISPVQAQDEVCYHDPAPLEAPSTEVPCDDPTCNVGPCDNVREVRQNVIEKKEERVQQQTEQKELRKAMLEKRVQDRIINLAANITSRFESMVNRFENIIERLDSRIEKLETLDVDTAAASAKLDSVKSDLGDVKEVMVNFSSVYEAVTGDTPREAFNVAKAEMKSVHESLRLVHAGLREVVALLKEAVREAELGRGVSDSVSERAESLRSDEAGDMRSGADPEKYLPVSN